MVEEMLGEIKGSESSQRRLWNEKFQKFNEDYKRDLESPAVNKTYCSIGNFALFYLWLQLD